MCVPFNTPHSQPGEPYDTLLYCPTSCPYRSLSTPPAAPERHRSGTGAAAPGSGTPAHSTHRMPPPQPHQVRGADGQRCTPRTARAEQAIQITDGLLTASSCLSTIYLHPHGCLSRSTRTQATCQLLYSQSVAIPAMRCRRRVALHCFPPSSFNPSMLKGSQNAALGSRVRCVVHKLKVKRGSLACVPRASKRQ